MLDPDVIIEPLRLLNQAASRDRRQRQDTAQSIDQQFKQLEAEEQRILDAYRQGFISPTQLGQQLEKLKTRRMALDLKRAEIGNAVEMPSELVEKAVVDYCAEATKNLAAFTFDQWQEFLQQIIFLFFTAYAERNAYDQAGFGRNQRPGLQNKPDKNYGDQCC